MKRCLLGVNIDHVATLRQARGTCYPDVVQAAHIAELAGADGITVHLREDRRHIQDRDVFLLKESIQTRLNLEMAVTEEMLQIAEQLEPSYCCLVPEKRQELTTEGGLDVINNRQQIKDACQRLGEKGVLVSLFIDPDVEQIDMALEVAAPYVEIHTGAYAELGAGAQRDKEFERIQSAVKYAHSQGLVVNAGHGLHYHNVEAVAAIAEIYELNIGHAVIARAVMDGLRNAVADMRSLLLQARGQ